MKRILVFLLAVMVFIPYLARAQSVAWPFFDRYSKTEGYASVQLERKMMRMMSRQAAEKGDAKLAELLDGIHYIRIVTVDGGDCATFLKDAEALASDPVFKFQLVMSESSGGQTTRFYLREAEFYSYSELLMLTYGPKETVAVNIYGLFDLKQVSRLSRIRPRTSEQGG